MPRAVKWAYVPLILIVFVLVAVLLLHRSSGSARARSQCAISLGAAAGGNILLVTQAGGLALAPHGNHFRKLNINGFTPNTDGTPAMSPDRRFVVAPHGQLVAVRGGCPDDLLLTGLDTPSLPLLLKPQTPFADHDKVWTIPSFLETVPSGKLALRGLDPPRELMW